MAWDELNVTCWQGMATCNEKSQRQEEQFDQTHFWFFSLVRKQNKIIC